MRRPSASGSDADQTTTCSYFPMKYVPPFRICRRFSHCTKPRDSVRHDPTITPRKEMLSVCYLYKLRYFGSPLKNGIADTVAEQYETQGGSHITISILYNNQQFYFKSLSQ